MLESSQKRRLQRIQNVKKTLSDYDGEGINFEEFKSLLQLNFGYSEKKVLEYLKILCDCNNAEIVGDKIRIIKA